MSKTTYTTRWGADDISVTADWAQASCPVEGDEHGRQVADFRHDGRAALRAALEDCASIEGMSDDEAAPLIEAALKKALEIDAE